MTNISETQIASCRKVEEHLINHSAREVTKARSSTVVYVLSTLTDCTGITTVPIKLQGGRKWQTQPMKMETLHWLIHRQDAESPNLRNRLLNPALDGVSTWDTSAYFEDQLHRTVSEIQDDVRTWCLPAHRHLDHHRRRQAQQEKDCSLAPVTHRPCTRLLGLLNPGVGHHISM
jgi:hypothetical protein